MTFCTLATLTAHRTPASQCYCRFMSERRKSIWLAAGLTFLPILLAPPVLAFARFSPTGPAAVWPLVLYAPLAMWLETRAVRLLLAAFRELRDPAMLAILPLSLVAVFAYSIHGVVLILGLPGLLKHLF